MKIAIITHCPNGLVGSFMAAQMLAHEVEQLKWEAMIEYQMAVGDYRRLTADELDTADALLLVGDEFAEADRFDGRLCHSIGLQAALDDPKAALLGCNDVAHPYQPAEPELKSKSMRIVAITACPTGVAHTFMTAEKLEEVARSMGIWLKAERRGSVGAQNGLTDEEIAAADRVLIAADINVDLSRFEGKPLFRTTTKAALKDAKSCIEQAVVTTQIHRSASSSSRQTGAQKEQRSGVYKHLMTGVSHMLPLVVAGGLAIAMSFIFGIKAFEQPGTLAAALMQIGGQSAFALMIPILAGFIAYSIADRPGLAPGLIGGMLASSLAAGFLGGIVAGFLAGYSAKFLVDKVQLPKSMEALKPILIVPLLASLITGLVMIYLVGTPIASLMAYLKEFLNNIGTGNALVLGALLGAMMGFDLGGPVNKTAYTFGVGLLASNLYGPMAAVMAAGMVPPLGLGLATLMARSKYSIDEREAGKAALVLGACFITEGAIPFAANDPLRVIPSSMIGSAVTGALSMLMGAQLLAPHGGIFVLLIPGAISPVFGYLLAIAAGTLVTAALYGVLRRKELAFLSVAER